MPDLNREEILALLRIHTATFAGMIDARNSVPKSVLAEGGGPENRGGLNRINELFALLQDPKPDTNHEEASEIAVRKMRADWPD